MVAHRALWEVFGGKDKSANNCHQMLHTDSLCDPNLGGLYALVSWWLTKYL